MQREASGKPITWRTLPSPHLSLVVPAERSVKFEEVAVLMQLGGDDRVNVVIPPTNDMEDFVAVQFDAEEDWDLRDISPSHATDVQSSLPSDFSAIQ